MKRSVKTGGLGSIRLNRQQVEIAMLRNRVSTLERFVTTIVKNTPHAWLKKDAKEVLDESSKRK